MTLVSIVKSGHPKLDIAGSSSEANAGRAEGKRIFLFDRDPHLTDLSQKLKSLGYEVTSGPTSGDGDKCLAAVIHEAADPGLELAASLAPDHKVIVLCESKSFEFKLKAVRLGVSAVVGLPVDLIELEGWFSDFDRDQEAESKVLIVDDDDIVAEACAFALQQRGLRTETLSNPLNTGQVVDDFCPDLIVMDLDMPEANGLDVAKALRLSRPNLSLPILFLSAERNEEIQHEARQIGGDDFIAKPVDLTTLTDKIYIRVSRARDLRKIMERDSPTGLLNHVNFKERLAAEVGRSRRTGSPMAVCLLDLDHFKAVNDTYGHQVGDRVIQMFGNCLSGSLRSVDVIARYGGEEFGVILLDATPEQGARVLDGIRRNFSNCFQDSDQGPPTVTFSGGVCGLDDAATVEGLLGAADEALYEAKRQGRNRIVLHSQLENP
ncbi:diguanylate cyclase domain-containing protein [Roseibium aggregatum]|uniref:diguanylate cyclase n=1 Tax=Roseibium aggregatum TaxID=187304 RepID=A0A926S8B9_9HYPH|nr:diguanylate cyclase [Roseibium aggregatum]MBD1549696.1 diguanylate cyclase [Roseibium aggregatum]